jgi:hypothetical protein
MPAPLSARSDSELFTRTGFVRHQTGQDRERSRVAPELRHRRFGLGD